VFEDIFAILLMVLLSTLAVSNRFSGGEMLLNLSKLAFFLILWFLVGIFVLPTVFKKAKAFLTDEILLIVSIGLCFGMVTLAKFAGFSSALGAFMMGSILAETVESERILKLIGGIKDLFSAIFFISVGMMVDPAAITGNWVTILILVVLVIAGHFLFSALGALLAGKGISQAVNTGLSLSQLGEFGFILAGLGTSLGVMRGFIYPVIVSVSVITTFTTPYMIKLAHPLEVLLMKRLPDRWISVLEPVGEREDSSKAEHNEWVKLIKELLLRVVLYGVILLAITIASNHYLAPLLVRLFPDWSSFARGMVCTTVTLLLMLPLLYGFAVRGGAGSIHRLLQQKKSNIWPILSMILLRIALAMTFVVVVISNNFNLSYWAFLLIVLIGGVYLFVARRSVHKFKRIEDRFFENLNEKEIKERRERPVTVGVKEKLDGYDVHLEMVTVNPESSFVGMKLKDVPVRKVSGANIIKIQRGRHSILIPGADEFIYPGDSLLAVGTSEQLEALHGMMEQMNGHEEEPGSDADDFTVEMVTLGPDSVLTGKALSSQDMRSSGCMVISYMRDGKITVNPKADTVFADGDVVWIAGEKGSVKWYS